jgi:hypothetical protein
MERSRSPSSALIRTEQPPLAHQRLVCSVEAAPGSKNRPWNRPEVSKPARSEPREGRYGVRVLLALGGNAMTAADGNATPDAQSAAIAAAMESVAGLIAAGHEVVITHGNGPQVGNLLVKNELAAGVVPPVSLDWCVAQTQATIGFVILMALERSLSRRGCDARVAAVVTRTCVDENDPGFANPTKPIGRFLPYDQAKVLIEHGQLWQDRGEKGSPDETALGADLRRSSVNIAFQLRAERGTGFNVNDVGIVVGHCSSLVFRWQSFDPRGEINLRDGDVIDAGVARELMA